MKLQDSLEKVEFYKQAKTFTSGLKPVQKVIIGSIIALSLFGIYLLISSVAKPEEKAVLYTSLEEKDAGKIVESLKEKKINYELKDGGTTILINKEDIYNTRLSLANEGLPESGIVGYELFDKTNLGMSEFVQKLNFRRALEGELARTISSLDEVKKARVHIVIPQNALFEKDQKEPTASVTLHFNSGRSLSKVSIEGIQNLIASSIEGMQIDAVRVIDSRGKLLSPPPMDINSVAGLTAKQHEQQRQFEEYLASKVQSILDGVLGVGNAEVRINADLDFTQRQRTITDFDPERSVIRSEQNIAEDMKSTDSLSYPAVNMDKKSSNVISNYEITKAVEQITEGVGDIKRLSIACLINGSYQIIEDQNGKSLQYVPRPVEEMEKLTEVVKNSVGYDPSRNDQVSVLNVPFDTDMKEDLLKEIEKQPWYYQQDNLKLFMLLAIMIITFFLLYRLLQSKQIKEKIRIAMGLPEKIEIEEEPEPEEEDEEDEMLEDVDLFDEDELLLLPADMPEQLLLEGEKDLQPEEELQDEDEEIDRESLAERARAALDDSDYGEDLSEDALMKLEMKNKVEEFVEQQTSDAVRLVRMFMQQDQDERGYRF